MIGSQISAVVVAKLDATHSMLQNALNLVLEGQTRYAINQSDDDGKINSIMVQLENDGNRMSRLEQKVDIILGQLQSIFGSSAPPLAYGGYDQ